MVKEVLLLCYADAVQAGPNTRVIPPLKVRAVSGRWQVWVIQQSTYRHPHTRLQLSSQIFVGRYLHSSTTPARPQRAEVRI